MLGTIVGFAKGIFGGVWGYVATAGVGAVIVAGLAVPLATAPYKIEVANLKAQIANQKATDTQAALDQFKRILAGVQTSKIEYGALRDEMNKRFDDLSRRFRNAIKAQPLPDDCKPDDVRLQHANEAIDAANKANTDAGHGFGETMRTDRAPDR
jgi:hypothetical protein